MSKDDSLGPSLRRLWNGGTAQPWAVYAPGQRFYLEKLATSALLRAPQLLPDTHSDSH
jgi:hypothetical protein